MVIAMINKYGFLLRNELLHVGQVVEGVYELVEFTKDSLHALGNGKRLLLPSWSWVTTSPTTLVHMYLKPEDYKGVIPSHPKATYGNARPVVIVTYRDGTTLHKEYREPIMPKLLPEGGMMIDTVTVGKDTRRTICTYHCPPTQVGTMYASRLGNKVGGTYFDVVGGESKIYGYLGHISKDDCLLIELDDDEVAQALLNGYDPTRKGSGVIDDTEYLEGIPGMVESIKEGMATPVEECSTTVWPDSETEGVSELLVDRTKREVMATRLRKCL